MDAKAKPWHDESSCVAHCEQLRAQALRARQILDSQFQTARSPRFCGEFRPTIQRKHGSYHNGRQLSRKKRGAENKSRNRGIQ
jgi:hypothetical protein